MDPQDADNTATALREAHEEIGLDPCNVTVVGCMQPFLSKHKLSVTPIVAVLRHPQEFRPCEAEVECIFKIPLALMLEDHPRHTWKDINWEPSGADCPHWYRIHFFDIHHQNVWGLTAAILIELAERGFQRPAGFQVYLAGSKSRQSLTLQDGQVRERPCDEPSRASPV